MVIFSVTWELLLRTLLPDVFQGGVVQRAGKWGKQQTGAEAEVTCMGDLYRKYCPSYSDDIYSLSITNEP